MADVTNDQLMDKLKQLEIKINSIEGASNTDNAVNILLAEYNSLRDELKHNFNIQIQLFSIIVTALGVAYGLIIEFEVYPFVLLVPFVLLPLGLRIQHSNYGVQIIGEYLEMVEKQLKTFVSNDEWEGYQTYWSYRNVRRIVWIYDGLSKYLLFGIIPIGIAIIYLFSDIFKNEFSSILKNPYFNGILIGLFIVLGGSIILAVNKLKKIDKQHLLKANCPQCKKELRYQSNYCTQCGTKLQENN